MKAQRIDGQTPGGKRTRLADVLPLSTPFSVQIFPIYGCNLACAYCIHSVPTEQRGFVAGKVMLDYALYRKCIDGLMEFPHPLKMLRFAGTGEPLLHPRIADMVAYAAERGVADTIDIVTNGLALTEELSRALIAARRGRIRISIQGLDDAAYAHTRRSGIFRTLVEQIRFFYEHRQSSKVYIKIIDCALKEGEEQTFLDTFGDISDFIAVEHLIPAVSQIDYDSLGGAADVTQNGAAVGHAAVCPQPFYMMQLNPDGMIVPCCSMETPYILGDLAKESMRDIWRGKKTEAFRRAQLELHKEKYPICAKCQQYQYAMFEEDVLDGDAAELLVRGVIA